MFSIDSQKRSWFGYIQLAKGKNWKTFLTLLDKECFHLNKNVKRIIYNVLDSDGNAAFIETATLSVIYFQSCLTAVGTALETYTAQKLRI